MIDTTLSQRLVLGTAQFGLAYGINNTAGRPTDRVVNEVLDVAQRAHISILDTAAAYGDSEIRLGRWMGQHSSAFQLVTKVAADTPRNVVNSVQTSMERLKVSYLYGLMFHDFGALQQKPEAWQGLVKAKAMGLTQRIGVSLYHPAQAQWLISQGWPVDLLQVPYNVLDQRFAALLPELESRGIEVHLRSAFLQGLLLRPLDVLPAFFSPIKAKLQQLRTSVAAARIPLDAALLLFAATAPGAGRVVIGVDSVTNLQDNLAAASYLPAFSVLRPVLVALAEANDSFILPYTWPTLR